VDRDEQQRMERLNREAAAEKKPDDPHAVESRDARPLVLLVFSALVVAVVVLGVMWVNNTRYDAANPANPAPPVADRR